MARPGISTKNTEKIPPGPKFWPPRISGQKYTKNTEKITEMTVFGIFSVFSGYFLGFPNFGSGFFFLFFGVFHGNSGVGLSRGSVPARLKSLNQSPLKIFKCL